MEIKTKWVKTEYPERAFTKLSPEFAHKIIRLFKKHLVKQGVLNFVTKVEKTILDMKGWGYADNFAIVTSYQRKNITGQSKYLFDIIYYPELGYYDLSFSNQCTSVCNGNLDKCFQSIWRIDPNHLNHSLQPKGWKPKIEYGKFPAVYFSPNNNWDSGVLYVKISNTPLPSESSAGWVEEMFGNKNKKTRKRKVEGVLFRDGQPSLKRHTFADVIFI